MKLLELLRELHAKGELDEWNYYAQHGDGMICGYSMHPIRYRDRWFISYKGSESKILSRHTPCEDQSTSVVMHSLLNKQSIDSILNEAFNRVRDEHGVVLSEVGYTTVQTLFGRHDVFKVRVEGELK